jgi:uncharacterized protein (DUF433 family)
MSTRTEAVSLIELDEQGRAWIKDANTKVIEVAAEYVATGWDVAEMHEQHPHLSFAELHAAMSYYFAHQAEFDAELERQKLEYERLWAESQKDPFVQKLRALKQARAA